MTRYEPKALAATTSGPLLVLLDDVLNGRNPTVQTFVPALRKIVETELDHSAIGAQLSGIQANLADKAKKLGLPVWKFGQDGA